MNSARFVLFVILLTASTLPQETKSDSNTILQLNFSQCMYRALREAPSIAKVESQIREAEYRVQESYTAAAPTLHFSSQFSRVGPSVSLPGGLVVNPANNRQFGLVLKQTISTFGRMKWSALAANLSRRKAQEEFRAELNRLITLVAKTYIEALLAQEQLHIAEDELEARLAALRRSELLFEQGVVAQFDVLRNSAETSQARQSLLEAQTKEYLARARLLSLMNESFSCRMELEPLTLEPPQQGWSLQQAKLNALESHPDLRALRWAVQSAKARVKMAKSSNNPTLELQNTTLNRNPTGFSPGTQNTTSLVLNIPLFDGGLSKVRSSQAKEVVLQLIQDLEQSERDVVLAVEQAYKQLLDRWRAIEVSEKNVAQAGEALRVAVLRYENGISTNVELLESQADHSQARFQLAQTRSQYLLSQWDWWQVTAGEYPIEVPLPPEVRERLKQGSLQL